MPVLLSLGSSALASSLTLQNAINFAAPILKNQVLLVSNLEPALTAANIVLSTIMGPPFRWAFNREEINFIISGTGGTDYLEIVPDFGFLEEMWLLDANNVQHALAGAISLGVNSTPGRPEKMARQFDDNQGNLTFRMDKLPDAAYTVYLDYQRKSQLITSPASFWTPVPDQFNYIFNYGFLCLVSLLVNDSRFPIFESYFISRLLGAQDGLSDQARNIFLGNWAMAAATMKRSDGAVGSGLAGRAR